MKKIFVSLIIVFALLTACEPEKNKVKDFIFSNNVKIAKVNTFGKKSLMTQQIQLFQVREAIELCKKTARYSVVAKTALDIQGSGAKLVRLLSVASL